MAQMTIATLNLFNRMGEWERRAPLVVEQMVELRPDVIGLQEVDLMLDQGMWLSREVNKRLDERPHYQMRHAASPGKLASVHGIGTMARLECVEHEIVELMTFDRIAQRLVFLASDARFAFVNTHLHHPPEATEERVQQLEFLLAWLDQHPEKLPTIVAGDFNAYVQEKAVALMKSRFRSAYETVHGREPEKTWTTPVNKWDDSPHGTLDYIFISQEFRVLDAGLAFDRPAADDPDLYPSDHLGVCARLEL